MAAVIAPLDAAFRALRTLQAPEQVVFDPASDEWRASSSAFKVQSDGTFSVDLEQVQVRDGLPVTHGYPRVRGAVGLVAHTVARLTAAGIDVKHEPVPGNDYHGSGRNKLSKSKLVAISDSCEVIVPLDGDLARRLTDEKLAKQAQAAAARAG